LLSGHTSNNIHTEASQCMYIGDCSNIMYTHTTAFGRSWVH